MSRDMDKIWSEGLSLNNQGYWVDHNPQPRTKTYVNNFTVDMPGDCTVDLPEGAEIVAGPRLRKFDSDKIRMSLVPPIVYKAIATVMTFGANKYGDHNWKQCSQEDLWRYRDAMERHWFAYRDGEYLDPESKKPHLYHVATNAAFLIYLEDKFRSASDDPKSS